MKEFFSVTMVPRGLCVRLRERGGDTPARRGQAADAGAVPTSGCPVISGGDHGGLDSQGGAEYVPLAFASAPLLEFATASLPTGQVGSSYEAQLSAEGGVGGLSWSVASGSLPAGLSLDAESGVISGTPSAAGSSPFTVQASSAGPPAQAASEAFSIVVAAKPVSTTTATTVVKAKPSISIETSKLKLAKASVKLSCKGAACKGRLELVETVKGRVASKGKMRTETRKVVLAKGSYTLAKGRVKTIALNLTNAGKLLAKRPSKHLTAKLTVTVDGGASRMKELKLG